MKGHSILIIASLLLLITTLSACNQEEKLQAVNIDNQSRQIFFFSDEANYELEASYYDAIIELKSEFPEDMRNLKTINSTEAEDYLEALNINECPAIVIYYQNKVLVEIHGKVSKEEILAPFKDVLSKENSREEFRGKTEA